MSALGLAIGLALLALISVAVAQSSRRLPPGLASASRAMLEGRYDEVAGLTSELDPQDPDVAAVNARALIARGRYQEAEAALAPVAARAPSSAAALELGLLRQLLGRADATPLLVGVASAAVTAREPAPLARAARALHALGRAEDANRVFRDAAAGAPDDPAINSAWGELFLDKQQKGEAVRSFKMALAADPDYVPALLGTARALADENPPQAVAMARKALELNASSVEAYVFLARMAADAGKKDEAREALRKARLVNPASLDAQALLAGLAYVEDKGEEFEAAAAAALAIAPGYGELFRVAGELTAHAYRFDEAVVLTRRGLALDPRNPRILADLGIHLLRTGDEPGAREVLEASFKIDPYDVVTYNLLQMMDTLDKFETVEEGDVILRMHRDEAPVLRDAAMALATRALATLAGRYQLEVRGPILIEMFPKHDDFAVRNLGLPGMIGALGACFGRVVTMDSPRARPPGDFQWEATLWHELAHVVTLQLSNQRAPRWLSEGLSVYEETLARPDWGRNMDVTFAGLLNSGGTIKLTELNAAFQNPETISLAYYQASLLVDHFVAAYGDEGVRRLLRAYGEGLDDGAALRSAFDADFGTLQTGFDEMLEQRFGDLRAALKAPTDEKLDRLGLDVLKPLGEKNPGSYPVQTALGAALREAGEQDAAVAAFARAAALAPMATGADSPHVQLAQIALEQKDRPRAIAALRAVMAADFDNIEAPRKLAELLKEDGVSDPAALRPVYARIVALDPFDAAARAVLGRLVLGAGDAEAAILEFKAVVALAPVDLAAAHADLAESYLQGGRRAEARKQTLAALEIAPSYERAQELLLRIAEGRP